MSRSKVEGLLASFTRLIDEGQEHTFVESDDLRFVYQPMESLYLVMLTTKTSNILLDLETLHLFARIVPEYCKTVNEEQVKKNAFELIFAFDEIVNMGYRESLSVSQLKTIIEMDSHDERVQEALARMKEREAREAAKLKAKQLEMQRREQKRASFATGMGGMKSGMEYSSMPVETNYVRQYEQPKPKEPSTIIANPSRGMKLGRKEKGAELMDIVKKETGFSESVFTSPSSESYPIESASIAPIDSIQKDSVHITAEERIEMAVSRDGGIHHFEVKGELSILVSDNDKTCLKIQCSHSDDKNYQFKKSFANEKVLVLRDPNRPLPLNQSLGLLKWRFTSQDEDQIPLSITCWPTCDKGHADVNVEYELLRNDLILTDVMIQIHIPSNQQPIVQEIVGEHRYDRLNRTLSWIIPVIDKNTSNGILEFSVDDISSSNDFFPVDAYFKSETLMSNLEIISVAQVNSGEPITFSKQIQIIPDEYSIQ
ncbi:coatomer subunit delta [Rozella allomycis CSF55]|uniref:Coatomer subunit delta n=1 Tax=Rozella allomycis (strain CSF55) TaxID=988480 RepID=A0A4P9YP61_ROZAC|nr:coatomer subunit delta [Rozella allomycis CSF55]